MSGATITESIIEPSALETRLQEMWKRLLRVMLIPPLLIAVTALVVVCLKNPDLLGTVIARVIVVIIIVGIPLLMVKTLLFPK